MDIYHALNIFMVHTLTKCSLISYLLIVRYPGGSSPIFVYGCAILRFETPPLSKTRQRRTFDLVVRQIWEKLTRKHIKMHGSVHLRKFFSLTLAKHAFFRGESLTFGRNRPSCKAFLGRKRHPFVRQNIKSGPSCKAKFSRTHPLK